MFPLNAYALGPVRFENPVGETEVRKWAREWNGTTKLPRGFKCWNTSD